MSMRPYNFKRVSFLNSFMKLLPLWWLYPTADDYDLNNHEFILHEDAFKQGTSFIADWF